jgi:hypothetical protein
MPPALRVLATALLNLSEQIIASACCRAATMSCVPKISGQRYHVRHLHSTSRFELMSHKPREFCAPVDGGMQSLVEQTQHV